MTTSDSRKDTRFMFNTTSPRKIGVLDACEDRGIDIIHTDIMKECEGFSDEYIKFFYTTNQDFGISSTVDGYSDLDSAYLLLYKIHDANHEMLTFDKFRLDMK